MNTVHKILNWIRFRMADCQDCNDSEAYEAFKAVHDKLVEMETMEEIVEEVKITKDNKVRMRVKTSSGFAWYVLTEDQAKKLKDIL